MADNILTENDGWTRHEQSVFKINRSFRPPFYVKTLGGYYDKEEELCFSAGDEYIILHKLKIKSVIASIVQGSHHRVSLKIPLDYAGKFYPISNSRTQSPEALPLKDMLYSNELPIEVRLGNPQQHGKLFLEKLRSNLDCVLKLSDQVTDDYFLGRSVDGKLVFLFSTEENMNFLVKKVNTNDVNHLLMNMAELKYDIFIVNVSNPGVQFLKLEDAVTNRTPPRRPPKPSSLPAGKSPNSPLLSPKQRSLQIEEPGEDHSQQFSYEVTTPISFKKPTLKPKPPKQTIEGKQSTSNHPPHHIPPAGNHTSPKSVKPQGTDWKQPNDHEIGTTDPTESYHDANNGENSASVSPPKGPTPPVSPRSLRTNWKSENHASSEMSSTVSRENPQGHGATVTPYISPKGSLTPPMSPRSPCTDWKKPGEHASSEKSSPEPRENPQGYGAIVTPVPPKGSLTPPMSPRSLRTNWKKPGEHASSEKSSPESHDNSQGHSATVTPVPPKGSLTPPMSPRSLRTNWKKPGEHASSETSNPESRGNPQSHGATVTPISPKGPPMSPRSLRTNWKKPGEHASSETSPPDFHDDIKGATTTFSQGAPATNPESWQQPRDPIAPLEHPSSSVISSHDHNITKSSGKQDLLVSFSASNTVQNRFGDKKTRKTLHKEVVTINFQKGGSSAKPAFSPPIPPIPTKKTKDQAKPPPPPLPSYPHPDDDEENDTDEEYNDKAAEQVTYPPRGGEDIRNVTVPPLPPSLSTHSRKPPPLPPPHEKYENMDENNTSVPPRRHFEKAARPDSDYLTPSQSLNQNDSDSDLSDYENIDSDLSDYERVEPQDEEPYRTPQSPLPSPTSPTTANISPKTKKKFNIKNKFSKLKWKNSKKEMASGDMADDELTEDPYAEQQADRRVSKKHYRSPHDALPMPTQPGPFSMPPSLPGHFIPPGRSLPSGRSQLPPPSHNIEDSDSDLSDYERVDDDEPKAAWKYGQGQPIRLQSPPKPASSMGGSMRQRLPDPNPKTGVPSNVGIVHPSTVQIVQPVKSSSEEFPRELCHLSVEAVAETLRKLKMPDNVVENFRDAQIDGQIFVCLDDNMLDQLEVGSLHKLKIIKFKNGWRPNHT
ncbi:uncharacterized protein [Amphiura filiformis]|uniref:uncharacterized protein isoform X2 n=1 Tax=Amphiura filiformis TaxID=82378 RepID=UPI003B210322